MPSLLIRGAVALIVVALLWLSTARSLSRLVDHVFLVSLSSVPCTPVGWNGVYLRFGVPPAGVDGPRSGWNGGELGTGSHTLDLEGPGPSHRPLAALAIDAGDRLVVSAHGRSLVLGGRTSAMSEGGTPPGLIPAYAAQPGDVGALTLERSWLSWPVFETNFMTGRSPSWRRSLYYRLSWTKRSGSRLDMLWRFEQPFYTDSGWGAPASRDGANGLIRVEIRPAHVTLIAR